MRYIFFLIALIQMTELSLTFLNGIANARQRDLKVIIEKMRQKLLIFETFFVFFLFSALILDRLSNDVHTEEIFEKLTGFRNLTHFDASFTQVTSKCANHLVKLPKLKVVNLAHSRYI